MKNKDELNALRKEVKDLNAKLIELNEDELKEVTGGGDSLHNMPQKKDDEKYVLFMQADNNERDTGKDHYENIILG